MITKYGADNSKLDKLFRLIPIILLVSNSIFVFSNNLYVEVTSASENDLEWSVTLIFNERGGANNNLVFGESLEASDAQDSYDIPIPPPGISPYIRPWFDADLNEPYNTLFYDIRNFPDDSKIWNVYVQWVPSDYVSSNNITISWDKSEIIASEYESVVLYDHTNDIDVADMLIDSNYTYTSSAMDQYHFQIICNTESLPSNNPPFQPSNPNPKDEATDVIIDSQLSWSGGDPNDEDEVTYDVYFGTNPTPSLVSTNQSSASYSSGTLIYNTNYYWKIISWDNNGLNTEGAVWHFTTKPEISPPTHNIPPIAIIKCKQVSYVNQTITFDALDSYDSDGFIQYYRWDFTNDGLWDTEWIEEATITQVFSNAGNYSINLQIKDNGGATNTSLTIISILYLNRGKVIPIADVNGPYLGITNQNITFDASGSYDSDGIILNYTWDFGDGIKNYKIKTNHKYSSEGVYSVTLLVVDNDGLTDIDATTAYIFNNDSDEDGWGDTEEIEYGSDPNNSEDSPLDTDNDHIPDSIDENDDNDGLSDMLEEKLGSDPKNKSDVLNVIIKDATHFLVDINKDGKSELFYNSRSGNTTELKSKGTNRILIDEDGDGQWDYLYNPIYGSLTPYQRDESSFFQILPSIIIIMFCLILIIIVVRFFYKKRLK